MKQADPAVLARDAQYSVAVARDWCLNIYTITRRKNCLQH